MRECVPQRQSSSFVMSISSGLRGYGQESARRDARAGAAGVAVGRGSAELVLSGGSIGGPRNFRKHGWCDGNIDKVIFNLMDTPGITVNGRPTLVSVPRDGDESAAFDSLLISSGNTQPFALGIEDAIKVMAFARPRSLGSACIRSTPN